MPRRSDQRERQQLQYDRIEREFREERHLLVGRAEDILRDHQGDDDDDRDRDNACAD